MYILHFLYPSVDKHLGHFHIKLCVCVCNYTLSVIVYVYVNIVCECMYVHMFMPMCTHAKTTESSVFPYHSLPRQVVTAPET